MVIDWRKVELDYRAGILSISAICREHDISRIQLMNKVANEAWSRDLMSQIRAEVNERLYLNRKLEAEERDHVAIAAQVTVDMVLSHRKDIRDLRQTISRTLKAINEVLDINVDLDPNDPEIDLVDKVKVIQRSIHGSLLFGKSQGVVNALDTLASAYQRVIAMERQAFGMEGLAAASAETDASIAGPPAATVQVYLPANHREPRP